ncbi:hypothetical protein [Nostoc sp. MG11]|uniref:hypothetical protein n=1 Tax=Nostoc sp. MG11 TaxID=2721166 RepID=UPI0018687BF7|nr:hypothetical protein [Nostoc sp. MG11]
MADHNVISRQLKGDRPPGKYAIAFIPITENLIMPQTIATVTPCVKPVEELTSVEISFYDHEIYCGTQLIATISYDDDLTQPWVVMVNDEEIHRANTFKRCHSYITWHYQRGTLPVQEETPAATTGNKIMVQIADECEQYGFEILDDGIYHQDVKLGEVGCTNGRWWVIRASSEHQQKVPCDSAADAVWSLSAEASGVSARVAKSGVSSGVIVRMQETSER